MRITAGICLVLAALLLSGCSYIGSFLICNFTGRDIVVHYSTHAPMSPTHLFSNEPEVFQARLLGDKVELGRGTLIPIERYEGIGLTLPTGWALMTGAAVNAWARTEEHYADLREILIIQGQDTTRITGTTLPSFVRELGRGKGLVMR